MRKLTIFAVGALALAIAAPAYAHVTVQPNEAVAGSFSRFVVRVPTEREVPTTKVRVEFPPLAFLAFEDKQGWTRQEKVVKFDEPLEAFGQELTEGVGSVTWSGGEIEEGEFAEFGFSAALPEEAGELEFKAYQTYQGGEVVEWTGPADADEPAARVALVPLEVEEGQGQLAVLADLTDRVEQVETDVQAADEEEPEDEPTVAVDDDGEDDDGESNLGVILGGAGLALGLIALIVALSKRKAA